MNWIVISLFATVGILLLCVPILIVKQRQSEDRAQQVQEIICVDEPCQADTTPTERLERMVTRTNTMLDDIRTKHAPPKDTNAG